MNPFVERMIRAAKLDVSLYEEVEADKNPGYNSRAGLDFYYGSQYLDVYNNDHSRKTGT